MFVPPLPPSLPPSASIIHPHIIAEQFKLWPTTCNLLRRERERERGSATAIRQADYVTPPVVRISPRHNRAAADPNSVCVRTTLQPEL